MIRNPDEMPIEPKHIRILIAGYPGIGKSTLGLSAPNPLHIDVDFGIDRIEARYRKPYIQPKSYDEILSDLVPENVKNFDTLVFDTGGKLISMIGLWAIKKDPKNAKRDGSLSLAGYGVVGKEFQRLSDYCFYELKKNLVYIFHAKEEKDGDNTKLRIDVEGQTKNNVWRDLDLGGFVEMYGSVRKIGFDNCERFYAKGTRGVHGLFDVPELTDKSANDFLARLFDRYNSQSAAELERNKQLKADYDAAMEMGNEIIGSMVDADTANAAVGRMGDINHALTSNTEVRALFKAKIAELGLEWDAASKTYLPREGK